MKDNDETQGRRTRRDHYRAGARTRRGSLRSRIGSGRGLYRDVRHKKILGVCAGLADYLQVERWKVRLVAVLALIFMSSATLITYFLAWFLMDKKPYYREVTDRYEAEELYDDDLDEGMVDESVTASPYRYTRGLSTAEALRLMKQKFQGIEERLRAMESHVTSSRFELQREFRNLGDEEQSSSAS
ncbi:MAG: envelope stress response membrane protein PspC [Pseudomonadales bacterium]